MNTRKFVSLNLFFILIFLIITGIVLYIMPHGRIAYWSGWTFLGLGKDEWDNLHIIFGFLFIVSGLWHVYINWNPIVNYLKEKNTFIYVLVLNLFFVITAIKNLPPTSWIVELSENIKTSWKVNKYKPPAPHAELLPLRKLCGFLGLSPEVAIQTLKENNIKVDSLDITLKEIQQKYGIPPYKVYMILLQKSPRKNIRKFGGKRKWEE